MRGRGLKHCIYFEPEFWLIVAPRAGAWIETYLLGDISSLMYVAPRAGAWIETLHQEPQAYADHVAPRAGAWIETCYNVK